MVLYDDADFEQISPLIRLIDVSVSAPDIDAQSVKPGAANGAIFARSTLKTRKVTIEYVILEMNEVTRNNVISAIAQWAYKARTAKLIVPQVPNGYLVASCTQMDRNSAADFADVLTIEFTAFDPYFHSIDEFAMSVGQPISIFSGSEPEWRIEMTVNELLLYPEWKVGDRQLLFRNIVPGELVIDSVTQTAAVDGRSILSALILTSRFPILLPGENNIETQNGAGGIIYWRERWI